MKLGKTAKNWLKIKEKLKFWHKKMVKNDEISWKEELSHPCKNHLPVFKHLLQYLIKHWKLQYPYFDCGQSCILEITTFKNQTNLL